MIGRVGTHVLAGVVLATMAAACTPPRDDAAPPDDGVPQAASQERIVEVTGGGPVIQVPRGRGAVVEYGIGSAAVSYFILPLQAGGMPEPGQFRYAHSAGYRAVMWSEMGLMHAMVGALPQPTLERLARDCIKQAARSGRMAFGMPRVPYS